MQIITGKTGTNHVTPEMDRGTHRAVFGSGEYVLSDGSMFKASIEASDTIRLSAGEGVMQGVRFCIPFGTYDDAIIDNGTTGYKRKDLIVAQYNRVGDIEEVIPVVIKGEPASSEPQLPEYTHANIQEGATMSQMPFYEVLLDGVNIISVTPLFKTITGLDDVYRKNEVYNKTETYTKAQVDAIKKELQQSIDTAQSTANTAKDNAAQAQSTADGAVLMSQNNATEIQSVHQALNQQIASVETALQTQIDQIFQRLSTLEQG